MKRSANVDANHKEKERSLNQSGRRVSLSSHWSCPSFRCKDMSSFFSQQIQSAYTAMFIIVQILLRKIL
jgi:hypothetical protein